jgi:hypothetical protein
MGPEHHGVFQHPGDGDTRQEANLKARVKASCDTITTSQDVGILKRLVGSSVIDF